MRHPPFTFHFLPFAAFAFAVATASAATINLVNNQTYVLGGDEANDLVVPVGATVTINGAGHILTGTLSLAGGNTVNIVNLNITMKDVTAAAIDISGTGNTLFFTGANTMTGIAQAGQATIAVPGGNTLTLDGTGTLTVTALGAGAAIGGGDGSDSGAITVNGGTVTAEGYWGAGLGGGNNGSGTVIINDGTITAKGAFGAGVGSGARGAGGTVTIGGGVIMATNSYNGAAIGGGWYSDGTVVISGGTVTAVCSYFGAAIGGGEGGIGAVTISGGTITAEGDFGAGIGSGDGGGRSTVDISGGTVTAKGKQGAGIGGGRQGASNTGQGAAVTISGGTVTATSYSGKGIGHGYDAADNGSCVITSGSVKNPSGASPFSYSGIASDGTDAVYLTVVTVTANASPVAGAAVSIGGYTAVADAAGKAYVWLPAASGYTFSATIAGLVSSTENVTVAADDNNNTVTIAPTFFVDSGWADDGSNITLPADSIVVFTRDHTHTLIAPVGKPVSIVGNGHTLTGALILNGNCTVYIEDLGITMKNVNATAINVAGVGNTLIFAGANTMTGVAGALAATVAVTNNCMLTLAGTGTLTVTAQHIGAAIGGGNNAACGTVIINSGTVTAASAGGVGAGSAGIGGGYQGAGGSITINGGTVTATSAAARGIGGGPGSSNNGSCKITGGSVKGSSFMNTGPSPFVNAGFPSNGSVPVYLATVTVTNGTSPVAGADITIGVIGGTYTAATDANGKAYVWLPPSSGYTFTVTKGAATAAASGIAVLNNDTTTAFIFLAVSDDEGNGVSIGSISFAADGAILLGIGDPAPDYTLYASTNLLAGFEKCTPGTSFVKDSAGGKHCLRVIDPALTNASAAFFRAHAK